MKRVLTLLMGVGALALTASRAEAVAYGPGQGGPGPKGGGFERWDANDDGVIDKAEFKAMRKALKNQQRKGARGPMADGQGRGRQRPAAGPGPGAQPPLGGPKAGRDGMPPHRGPAPLGMADDEGPGGFDGPPHRGLGRGQKGPEGARRGQGKGRGPGKAFAGGRGPGEGCPECGCQCGRGKGEGPQGRRGMRGHAGPNGPEFGAMRRGAGRGFGPGQGPGFGPFGDMGPGPDGPPMMRRGGQFHGQPGQFAPNRRSVWRRFAMRAKRFGRQGRRMGPPMFDRFDANDDNFITPDEFPGRPERFDRWDADDDGRIEKGEIRRQFRNQRGEGRGKGMNREGRGRGRGPGRGAPPIDDEDDFGPPPGPRAEKASAL